MKFDVIIPTRGSIPQLKSILSCIGNQTLQPKTIILVVNGISDTEEEWKKHFATFMPPELQLGVEVVFIPHTSSYANNASCARNIGIQNATSPYVYLLDDDNIFGPTFFAASLQEYMYWYRELDKDIIYSPTVLWRQTDRVQSRGFRSFHYWLSWPEPMLLSGWKSKIMGLFSRSIKKSHSEYVYGSVRPIMMGGNSLLSTKNMFLKYPFHARIPFVFEDLEMTMRAYASGVPLVVSTDVMINHMEREKTLLEHSFAGSSRVAYEKAKNRILLVKRNASLRQKIQFFVLGLWINTVWFLVFILVYGGSQRFRLIRAYLHGTAKGLWMKAS